MRITNPVPEAVTDAELEETLTDVLEEVNKRRDVLAALVITKDLELLLPAAEVGDIYVQFATSIQADICILCESKQPPPPLVDFQKLSYLSYFVCLSQPLRGECTTDGRWSLSGSTSSCGGRVCRNMQRVC